MTTAEELIRDLRARRIMCDGGNGNVYDIADETCEAAASLIEALSAEKAAAGAALQRLSSLAYAPDGMPHRDMVFAEAERRGKAEERALAAESERDEARKDRAEIEFLEREVSRLARVADAAEAQIAEARKEVEAERERCANIAEAIDSGRGNEKEIAAAIRRGVG